MISDSVPAQTPEPEALGGQPSVTGSPRPRWLSAGAAAVVVLAVAIGLVAGVTLMSQRTGAGAAGAASYVPADATFYYEVRLDLPGDQRANLRAFLGHFSKVNADKYLTDAIDQQLDSAGAALPSGFLYSTAVKPWFDGTLAVAMIGYPSVMPAMTNPMAGGKVPDLLLFAGVRNADAANAVNDRIRAEAARSGATVHSTAHGSATIWSAEAPTGSGAGAASSQAFAWTVSADEVVAGSSVDLVARALDVHTNGGSLASRAEFRDGLARLPADRVGVFALDPAPVLAQLKKDTASAKPGLSGLVNGLSGYLPTYVVQSARFEAGRFVLDATAAMSTTPESNRDLGLAAVAPSDALFYADAADAGKALNAFVTTMKASVVASGGTAADQLDQAEKVLGGDLGSFVSWMHDAALVAGQTGGEPYAGLIATTTDAGQARTKLLQLQGLIQLGSLSKGPKVTVTEADHNGTKITTFKVDAASGTPSWATTYQYAVTNDKVVMGMGDRFVTRVLDMQSGGALAGQARFRAALDNVGGSPNRGSFWLDLAGLRAALEPLIPANFAATYRSEVLPWVSPWDYVIGASRTEGNRVESHFALVVK